MKFWDLDQDTEWLQGEVSGKEQNGMVSFVTFLSRV